MASPAATIGSCMAKRLKDAGGQEIPGQDGDPIRLMCGEALPRLHSLIVTVAFC